MKFYSSFSINAQNCLNNRAIAYGDGVFETLLVFNKKIALWQWHWQRLTESLQKLNLQALNETKVQKNLMSLIEGNHKQVVKLVVFRAGNKRGYASSSQRCHYYITVNPYQSKPIKTEITVSAIVLSQQKSLAGIKHLNRLEQVLAATDLLGSHYDDAIMCDQQGRMIETISKNIVLIKNEKLYLPNLDQSGVFGVALRWLQAQAQRLEMKITWKKIELKDLSQYHAMMVCNSIHGFHSILQVDENIRFNTDSAVAEQIKLTWSQYL